jgi:hypothetical protein
LTADAYGYISVRAADFNFYAPAVLRMSKGSWVLDPWTGISSAKIRVLLPDEWLDGDLNFNRAPLPDCDLFCVSSIAHVAGIGDTNMTRVAERLIKHPLFHCHVRRLNGVRVIATHTTSAAAGGRIREAEAREQQLANLVQFKFRVRG